MEHHQFGNNEWIQCKVCNTLFDTPCIFHKHGCNQNGYYSDGCCLICQKFLMLEAIRDHQKEVKWVKSIHRVLLITLTLIKGDIIWTSKNLVFPLGVGEVGNVRILAFTSKIEQKRKSVFGSNYETA